jgi:hypothetical protein
MPAECGINDRFLNTYGSREADLKLLSEERHQFGHGVQHFQVDGYQCADQG